MPPSGTVIRLVMRIGLLAFAFAGLALAPSPSHALNVAIEWTAPGDDSVYGRAVEYDLRYSQRSNIQSRFYNARRVAEVPTPGNSGSVERAIVPDLDPGATYYFALRTRDERGNWSRVSNVLIVVNPTVGVDGTQQWKLDFSDAFPSPASHNTHFALTLAQRGPALIDLLDVSGRRVRKLHDGALEAGPHTMTWDLRTDDGQLARPGVYFVRAAAGGQEFRRRVIVVR